MPVDSGRYTISGPRAYDETKRYVAVLAQSPLLNDVARPLHSKDWNDSQQIIQRAIQRAFASAAGGTGPSDGDGLGFKPLAFTANNPKFSAYAQPASEIFSAAPFYYVSGLAARADCASAEFTWDSTDADQYDILHRKSTAYVLNTVTDKTARYKTNELTSRTACLMLNNGAWSAALTISANGADSITTVGGPAVGTAGATYQAGLPYRINPSTPGSARTDAVWLDVWQEEIAADAVAGSDPFNDTSLNINFGGTTIEPTRRAQIRQALFIEEGAVDTSKFVAASGSAVSLNDVLGEVWKYTDSSGITHYLAKLAEYSRYPMVYASHTGADVGAEYITDKRLPAGIALTTKIMQATGSGLARSGVLQDMAATNLGSNVARIDGGSFVMNGIAYEATALETNRPTDGSSTVWANTTQYYALIDEDGRCVVRATTAPTADEIPICRFLTDGSGNLPTFTEGVNYNDTRRFLPPLAAVFQFDSNSRIRNTIEFANSNTNGSVIGMDFYNKAGAFAAGISYQEGGISVTTQSTEQIGLIAGGGSSLVLEATTASGILTADEGMTFQGNVAAPWDATTVPVWNFDETKHNKIVSPGVWLGTSAGESPVSGAKLIVPSSKGVGTPVYRELPAGSANTRIVQGCQSYLDAARCFFNRYALGDTGGYNYWYDLLKDTGADAANSGDLSKIFWLVPLGIPMGMNLLRASKISIPLTYSMGAATATIVAHLIYRDTAAGALTTLDSTPSYAGAVATCTGGPGSATMTVDPGTDMAANEHALLYIAFWMSDVSPATSFTGTSEYIDIGNISVDVQIKGIGKHAGSGDAQDLAFPFPGLIV